MANDKYSMGNTNASQGFLKMLGTGASPFSQQLGAYNPQGIGTNAAPGNLSMSNLNPAQVQLKSYTTPTNYGGGNPGYGGYGSKNSKGNLLNGGSGDLGQNTPWEWGGEGGKAATAISAIGTLGQMYLGNEARKLAASDLDFRRGSFDKQYGNEVATVNDELYDRQRRRGIENGLSAKDAGSAADRYVNERGVGQERNA